MILLFQALQLPENFGMIARTVKNFSHGGSFEIRLISPCFDHPSEVAYRVSRGAEDVIDGAKVFGSLQEAVTDIHHLYGTCSYERDIIKEWVDLPHIQLSHLGKTGILFGPERVGLSREELTLCHSVLRIPTAPEFSSLNIVQSVAIILYELTRSQPLEMPSLRVGDTTLATCAEVDHFFSVLELVLDKRNYWRVPSKKPVMWQNLRNVFTRSSLTKQEITTLIGLIKSLNNQ